MSRPGGGGEGGKGAGVYIDQCLQAVVCILCLVFSIQVAFLIGSYKNFISFSRSFLSFIEINF